jgi:hypothetical protein
LIWMNKTDRRRLSAFILHIRWPTLTGINTLLEESKQSWDEKFEDTKGVIKSRNRRRTDHTIAKRKRTKEQTTIDKTLYRKLKIEQHELHYKPGVNSIKCSGRISCSCSTLCNCRVTLVNVFWFNFLLYCVLLL